MSVKKRKEAAKRFVGQKFHKILITGVTHKVFYCSKKVVVVYLKYTCDCGKKSKIEYNTFLKRENHSCGCIRREARTHGATCGNYSARKIPPEYRLWANIKNRCYNVKYAGYKDYGGRGIRVCDEWRNSFESFYKYIGNRPSASHSLDRINNDGNYEPGNVRWATRKEQNNNTRITKYVNVGGKKVPYSEAELILNLRRGTLTSRINNMGWDEGDAVSTPLLSPGYTRKNKIPKYIK